MAETPQRLGIFPLRGIPLVNPGDDLAAILLSAIDSNGTLLADDDILVVAQKIVSKAEGRTVLLADVHPSEEAVRLAEQTDKDPRIVELILRESVGVVRAVPGVLIVRHRLGIVSANAGIDQSNINHAAGETALLLPLDPDQSANALRAALEKSSGKRLGVIISDSVNRPWRLGSIGIAIGCAGVCVVDDRRGTGDLYGRELKITMSNDADAIASAALLVMGETDESIPAALVRGLQLSDQSQGAADAIRPLDEDLFG